MAHRWLFIILFASFCFPLVSYGQESPSKKSKNVVLTPADQLILEAIDKVNERIDEVAQDLNGRIERLRIGRSYLLLFHRLRRLRRNEGSKDIQDHRCST